MLRSVVRLHLAPPPSADASDRRREASGHFPRCHTPLGKPVFSPANARLVPGDTARAGILSAGPPRVTPVKAFRRALVAVAVAGLAAAVARPRGRGGVPPQGGGWRERSGPDLRW